MPLGVVRLEDESRAAEAAPAVVALLRIRSEPVFEARLVHGVDAVHVAGQRVHPPTQRGMTDNALVAL